MLIANVRTPNRAALTRAIQVARGDVVSIRPDPETKGYVAQLVLREEAELDTLRASGANVEVVFDSRSAPDPREEVGKGDRYAEELDRLRRPKGQA